MRILIGDIGGTNARLIMYEASEEEILTSEKNSISKHKVISQMQYKNNDFISFSDVIWNFMHQKENIGIKVHTCCFAVAGPVDNNQINFTNREGWIVDGHAIEEDLNIDKAQLLNDFVANGYGLLTLSDKDFVTLQKGNPSVFGSSPIALLGAGTGLGECFLTPTGNDNNMKVFPTEGGHVEFAPCTELEIELLLFLRKRYKSDRVSVERVVSGKGLENIYEFLREKYADQVNDTYDAMYNSSSERGGLIGREKYNYQLFKQSLQVMFSIYGGEAGNVALKYLPQGGVYIAGGIAPKNMEFITNQDATFLHRFLDKGRMSSIMNDFPVHIVLKEELGLRGAHLFASQLCKELLHKQGIRHVDTQTGQTLSKQLSFATSIRQAIQQYPISYAVIISMTAAATAGACFASQYFLMRKHYSFR